MNELEKLYLLINKSDRVLKYGEMTDEMDELIVALKMGECVPIASHMADDKADERKIAIVQVYSVDYLAGLKLSDQIKSEIKSAVKYSVNIMHALDNESVYDQNKLRYVFKSNYKILKI